MLGTLLLLGSPASRSSAAAPPGRYAVSPSTVLDQATGLVWQRTPDQTIRTFAEAQSYCNSASLPGSGWRVPSVKELQTLTDETVPAPSLDPVFDMPEHVQFWSSSHLPTEGSSDAWYVWLSIGAAAYEGDTVYHSVRCVR
jgi:hypothetical protein